MKIAVIGSGPVALEAALDFYNEGAHVKVIGKRAPCSKLAFMGSHSSFKDLKVNADDYTTPEGLEFLGLQEQPETYRELWENYYSPLIKKFYELGLFHQREVLRVQKRFLDPKEEIPGHSRLFDLFRLTYGLNPSGLVEEQIKENPELEEKLGQEILSSLKNQVESFEDFDLIFDCRGSFQKPIPLGAGHHYALNEKSVAALGGISYGLPTLEELQQYQNKKVLTLVGSGKACALTFLALEDWLEKPGNILNIISSERSLFKGLLESELLDNDLKIKLKELIKRHMELWRQDCLKTEEELHKWRDLPLHEKNKVPQPQFPEPKLRLFEGYSVSSVDRLIDRDGLFLTLEIPQWRDAEKKELVTVAQDHVIAAVGYRQESQFSEGLHEDEPGYFAFFSNQHHHTPKASLERLPLVKSDIFKFFSKA